MASIEIMQQNPLVVGVELVAQVSSEDVNTTKDLLITQCSNISQVLMLLRVTANYWDSSPDVINLDKVWFVVARVACVISCVFSVMIICSISSYHSAGRGFRILYVCFNVAMILRVVTAWLAQYFNQNRLVEVASSHELVILHNSAVLATKFGVAATLTNLITTALLLGSGFGSAIPVFLPEYVLVAYLAFNMFFLLLDVNTCASLLEKLHSLADNKLLTITTFLQAKHEIQYRARKSQWVTDLVMIPCVLCAFSAAVLIFALMDYRVDEQLRIFYSALISLALKEMMFMCIAFWYVAKLNGRADELTAKLADTVWGEYSDRAADLESSALLATAQVSDIHRLSIYASSLSKPISYTLVFKRVTWWNVAVSAGSFVLAIVIGIIRNLVLGYM